MTLLEREPQLQALRETLAAAAAGEGRVALVGGEAGIGKTSLVEEFVRSPGSSARVLWGACDALFTPRPLGPLYDVALQIGPDLLERLKAGQEHHDLFTAFLADLQSSRTPSVVVFEDVHWADEATLDLIKFIGRRIRRAKALLVLTYRDDEVGAEHPLYITLGDLPTASVVRVPPLPLTEKAVAVLAEQANRPAEGLHRVTGGNPFFVTEMLANDAEGVPAGVREAVLARAARLSPSAREVLDPASAVPGAIEHWLLEAVLHPSAAALDECVARGILHAAAGALAFRHELARRALEDAIPAARARDLHASILQALIQHGADQVPLPRLVHHAVQAGDSQAVLRYAPVAAQQASALGAHREAAAHYRVGLRYAELLSAEARADLLDNYASECDLTAQPVEARRTQLEALGLWRELGRRDKEGRALHRLSDIVLKLSERQEMYRYVAEATAVLEQLPPSQELAMAYSSRSRAYVLAYRLEEGIYWGTRARELAEQLGDTATLAHALNNIGTAKMKDGQVAEGRAALERSLELSLGHGLDPHAARAYANLVDSLIYLRDYPAALSISAVGIAYCAQRDIDLFQAVMLCYRAQARLEQGRWAEVEQELQAARESWSRRLEEEDAVRLLLKVRSGEDLAPEEVDAARELARISPLFDFECQLVALLAEVAWLRGDLEAARAAAEPTFKVACQRSAPREVGNLAVWLWRAGALAKPPPNLAEPYAAQIAGDWKAAAAGWEQFGCPYEQALALLDGDEAAQREALAIFERLGAAPAAALARAKLRAAGVRSLPRGPRATTRENPFGLTARQMEVLALLAEGLSNTEISARLHISARTVDHHVAAILGKLEVPSRQAAVQLAANRGLLS